MLIQKKIQQIEFIGQLKDNDGENDDGTQSMFVLTALEISKEISKLRNKKYEISNFLKKVS